jgi:hypothetical protein
MATKKRSTMAKLERALMKDIDEREAKEEAKSSVGKTLFPFDGVTAKSALRKASDANIDGEYENLRAYKQGIEDSLAGQDRDLRSIEKYGDDAMRSKNFGSRETKKMNMGGKVAGYKNGGCVMAGRGGKYKGAM